jgi:hypothetical protein
VGPNPASLGEFGGAGGSAAVGNYAAAIEDAGVASLIAGGATAAGAVGAGRDGGKSGGRSTPAEQQVQKDVFGNDPEFQDPVHAGPQPAAGRSLVSFEESAGAAEAKAAERFAVTTEQAEPSFLQPATRGRPGEDDRTHRGNYVQGEDVFADGRLVTPPVIGDNEPTEPTEPPAGASGDPADDTDGDDGPAGFGD